MSCSYLICGNVKIVFWGFPEREAATVSTTCAHLKEEKRKKEMSDEIEIQSWIFHAHNHYFVLLNLFAQL